MYSICHPCVSRIWPLRARGLQVISRETKGVARIHCERENEAPKTLAGEQVMLL